MKAWVVEKLADPAEALALRDVPEPTPQAGQIKVKVLAAALNYPDILLCQGLYQERPKLPFIPGLEVCGEVVEVGAEAAGWHVGDLAFGGTYSDQGVGGGFGEYAVMSPLETFHVPEGMPPAQAAGYLLTYQTSWLALHHRARITSGDVVLVHAGAGGVGSAAIQIAKAAGATVIATAGGERKKELLTQLGADHAIDYLAEDFVAVVKDITDGRGADIVYDPVGGDVYDKSTKCIAFEGRILIVGFTSGRLAQAATNHILVKNYSVLGVHWGYYRQMLPELIPEIDRQLATLYGRGVIDPYVSRQYSFSELPQALGDLSSRETTGKVVIVP